MTTGDRHIRKVVNLRHLNGTVTSLYIYPFVEIEFKNLFLSSNYLELEAKGFRTTTPIKLRMPVIKSARDSLTGKYDLLVHIAFILGASAVLAIVFYGCLRTQQGEKEAEVNLADLFKRAEGPKQSLLDGADLSSLLANHSKARLT